jgi:hypothetical protein
MEKIALNMQHEEKVRWRYEWSLERKSRWLVQKLLSRRNQYLLKRWLRHAKNLSDEGKRLFRDLIYFQVGNEKRSIHLINFEEGRRETPIFQVGKG